MRESTARSELAYRITGRGGTAITAGLPDPRAMWLLQAVTLIGEEHTSKGSHLGRLTCGESIRQIVSMNWAFQRG